MKMKADLNETRSREKQMWDAVNEKRDVSQYIFSKSKFQTISYRN